MRKAGARAARNPAGIPQQSPESRYVRALREWPGYNRPKTLQGFHRRKLLIPRISFVDRDAVFRADATKLILERLPAVTFHLVVDIRLYFFDVRRTE